MISSANRRARGSREADVAGRGELIEQDADQPGLLGLSAIERADPRDVEDQLAEQRRHRDRADLIGGGAARAGRRQPRDVDRAHRDRRAHDLGVLRAGRHPDRAIGRDDMARLVGDHLEVAARGERQLVPRVVVGRLGDVVQERHRVGADPDRAVEWGVTRFRQTLAF